MEDEEHEVDDTFNTQNPSNGRECGYCFKTFEINKTNFDRHEKACKKKKDEKNEKSRKRKNQQSMLSYFVKKSASTEGSSHTEPPAVVTAATEEPVSEEPIDVDVVETEEPVDAVENEEPVSVGETEEPVAVVEIEEAVAEVETEIAGGIPDLLLGDAISYEGIPDCVVATVSTVTIKEQKCSGYNPVVQDGDIYENFPFHHLNSWKDVVFEDGTFHSPQCAESMYRLEISNATGVNHFCEMLSENEKMQKYITDANDPNKHTSTTNNKYLTFKQLGNRVQHLQSTLNKEKLKSLNNNRKLVRLNKSLLLHQRFMILIRENSIPKLHELVKVAMNRKRGLEYTINKIVLAVEGVYNPHSSEDDKDLAFLILQYGGPGLLDIVHRALNFPSTSTAYRLLQSSRCFIISSVNIEFKLFVNNIIIEESSPKYGHMLKIDETYNDPKVRWNSSDNCLYGLCYEHGQHEDVTFVDYKHVEELANKVKEGELHVPKETMVLATSSNSVNCKAQIVAALPTCSKKETEFQSTLIDKVSSQFAEKNGAPFLNYSTDGDATRRIIFDYLMRFEISPISPIYETVSKLRLMDKNVARNDETVNFDPKHLAKRLRKCISGDNLKIGTTHTLLQSDVLKILSCTENSTNHSNENLINPKDKQNVPLATILLSQFCNAVEDIEKLKTAGFRVANVAVELHLFSYVIQGVLITYTKPNVTIQKQLETIAQAAHVLFVLQRTLRTFIPNQLYHDLQSTFKDAFYCAAKWKEYHPNIPFFLMLCSNDVIERLFGNLRLKYRHSAIDNLEIIYAARSLQLLSDMMIKHPDWFSCNRNVMERLCLDYSSPKEWRVDGLILEDVDIVSVYNVGRAAAEQVLGSFAAYRGSDFFELAAEGYTFLIPYGTKKIGVSEQTLDYSIEDDDEVEVLTPEAESPDQDEEEEGNNDIEDSPSSSIIDMVPQDQGKSHDPQIQVEGSYVYKASVVKSLFSSNPLSRDRLRRVRGMTKFTDEGDTNSLAIETSVMAGDPMLVNVKGTLRLSKILEVRKANRKVKLITAEEINDHNVTLDVIILKLETSGENYVWTGNFVGDKFRAKGVDCYAIQPTLEDVDGKIQFSFDKQFILDLNVGITLEAQSTTPSSSSSSSSAVAVPASTSTSKSQKTSVECFTCKKNVDLSQMRKHVGMHIVKGALSGHNVCGFCGKISCENVLIHTTTKGTKKFFKIQSNCRYFVKWAKTPVFSTHNPCSNHLVVCPAPGCKASIWTYNAEKHYAERHPDVELTQMVSAEETKKMKNAKL